MTETRYRKGDRVKFRYGTHFVVGVITEDRGPIGVNGRRLYEVLVEPRDESSSDPWLIELPAAEIQSANDPAPTR
jgi:hypothetical protein